LKGFKMNYVLKYFDLQGISREAKITEAQARVTVLPKLGGTSGSVIYVYSDKGALLNRIETLDERDEFFEMRDRNRQWQAKPSELPITMVEEPIDANLKTRAAIGKPKLSDVPPIAFLALGAAMSDGAKKYGRFNWRETGATSSIFYDAIFRHLIDWYNGEDHAHDSKVHHLGHVMAGCAIILDAETRGTLNDDRDKSNPTSLTRNAGLWQAMEAQIALAK
jgi:hypothetical protein